MLTRYLLSQNLREKQRKKLSGGCGLQNASIGLGSLLNNLVVCVVEPSVGGFSSESFGEHLLTWHGNVRLRSHVLRGVLTNIGLLGGVVSNEQPRRLVGVIWTWATQSNLFGIGSIHSFHF